MEHKSHVVFVWLGVEMKPHDSLAGKFGSLDFKLTSTLDLHMLRRLALLGDDSEFKYLPEGLVYVVCFMYKIDTYHLQSPITFDLWIALQLI